MNDILVNIAANLENMYMDKYVDEEFLKWIFDEVVDFLGICEHVANGFTFGGESPMLLACGGYDSVNKRIQFFDLSLPMARNTVHNQMKITDDERAIIATNILMVGTLLHEIEHANQKKKVNDGSFEGYILSLEEGNTETISTYDYIPSERFAENIALGQVKTILNNMSVIMPDIEDYIEKRRNHWIIKGYVDEHNECMVPALKRYTDVHDIKFSNIDLDEALLTYPSLDDRLFYGLPITDDEYFMIREKAGLDNSKRPYSLW